MSFFPLIPTAVRRISACGLTLVATLASAQETLTLEDALRLAKERNGTVVAALYDIKAAKARVGQARSAFFPTVTPSYRYNSSRQQVETTTGSRFIQGEGGSSQINSSWRLFDTGERQLTLLSGTRSERATRQQTLQTLRNVLFDVYQQYFNALRAEELEKVAQAQVDRTQKILDQTNARVSVGDAPLKDVYQAKADALNAKVEAIASRNATTTAEATLKATIGWEAAKPLPTLVASTEPVAPAALPPLDQVIAAAVRDRADLAAERWRLEAQQFSVKLAEKQAGPTAGLDFNFNQQLTPISLQDRTFSLLVSMPLFDGGRSREAAREARFNLQASRAQYVQDERLARSEVEAAYAETSQNAQRLEAARLALEAARENYQAAVGAFAAGAQGTSIVTVATAQVSLATAEANNIQATYDYNISNVRLQLVSGRPVPGER